MLQYSVLDEKTNQLDTILFDCMNTILAKPQSPADQQQHNETLLKIADTILEFMGNSEESDALEPPVSFTLQQQINIQNLNQQIATKIRTLLHSNHFDDLNLAVSVSDNEPVFSDNELQFQGVVYDSRNQPGVRELAYQKFGEPIALSLEIIMSVLKNQDNTDIIENADRIADLLGQYIADDGSPLEDHIRNHYNNLLQKTRLLRIRKRISACINLGLLVLLILMFALSDMNLLIPIIIGLSCSLINMIYDINKIDSMAEALGVTTSFLLGFPFRTFENPRYLRLEDEERTTLLTRLAGEVQTILQLVKERNELVTRIQEAAVVENSENVVIDVD